MHTPKSLFIPSCVHGGEELDISKLEYIKNKIVEALNLDKESKIENKLKISVTEKEKIAIFSNNLSEIESEIDLTEIINQINLNKIDLEEINRKLADLERQNEDLTDNDNLKELEIKRDDLESENEKLKESEIISKQTIEGLHSKIESISKELDTLLAKSEKNEEGKKYIRLLNDIYELLENYIDELIQDRKIELQKKTSQMFFMLVNNDSFKEIIIDDDFQVKILNHYGIQEDIQLSSGLKQILMTALIWGLEQTAINPLTEVKIDLPIIIDTPLARLDPDHRKNLLDNYFPKAAIQVIILSQPSEITQEYRKLAPFKNHLRNGEYLKLKYDQPNEEMILKILNA